MDPPPEPSTIAPALDPMGGPSAAVVCNTGYIVQVASDVDVRDYEARIAEIRAGGVLPEDAQWTQTTSGCPIFTGTTGAFVLYVGGFASPYDACATRLASPADAFIRSTSPGSNEFISCLCPASTGMLATIVTPGQTSVWVGELQRILGHLNYGMDDIDAGSAAWGTYSSDTRAAVARFQAEHGLPADSSVGAKTWAALQAATC